ncbi:MAG: TIGR01777 family oxidoreductase [Chloroflexota bacterium]
MRVLIVGGRGFLGGALRRQLRASGYEVIVLTRAKSTRRDEIHWDGAGRGDWMAAVGEADAVINACGYGLEHWPWDAAKKRRFVGSRVEPGFALAKAVAQSSRRPRVFIQFSGINRYGLGGAAADETTPAAGDFLAQLTVGWEAATQSVEAFGVRRVVVRNAIVLDAHQGLFPLMSLPAKLFVGGRLGSGGQAVPWIHLTDHVRAVQHLLEDRQASGAFNLVSPVPTTNAEFMEATCKALRRPFWLHMPAFALRLALGEMGVLVLAGRPSQPIRLLNMGFRFAFPTIDLALQDLFSSHKAQSPPSASMAALSDGR